MKARVNEAATRLRRSTHRMPLLSGMALIALPLALVTASCSKSTERTYIDAHVSVDDSINNNELYLVTACGVRVMSTETVAPFYLPCQENRVRRDTGTFQFASRAQSGTIQLVVSLLNANFQVIGEGQSEAIPASPGKPPIKVEIVVKNVATGGVTADGGSDTADTTDGGPEGDALPGADGGTNGDASTDTEGVVPDGAASDAATTSDSADDAGTSDSAVNPG